MRKQPPKPVSWDGAPLCAHLGHLDAQLPDPRVCSKRIGISGTGAISKQRAGSAICVWRTLTSGGIDITDLGNHHGMSATVLLDPALELHFATGEQRYPRSRAAHPGAGGAQSAAGAADAGARRRGRLRDRDRQGVSAALEPARAREAAPCDGRCALPARGRRTLWRNIRDHHLTLGGGPWGGVAHRSREVFNPATVFSPYGYVETCSTLAWIQLNRELLAITGEAAYAEEIERSAYNDLLGAQAPDGEDWCYYSFPNGRRVHTTYWRCCKSSGAMALEELPSVAYASAADGVQSQLARSIGSDAARARCRRRASGAAHRLSVRR